MKVSEEWGDIEAPVQKKPEVIKQKKNVPIVQKEEVDEWGDLGGEEVKKFENITNNVLNAPKPVV